MTGASRWVISGSTCSLISSTRRLAASRRYQINPVGAGLDSPPTEFIAWSQICERCKVFFVVARLKYAENCETRQTHAWLPSTWTPSHKPRSLIPETFLLVEQIGPRTSQVDDLGTSIAILLKACAFKAVERITDTLAAADDTLVLVVSEGALVADADQGCWAHVGIADRTFSVAFVTQAADRNAGLLAAHDEVGVVTRHCDLSEVAKE